MRKAGMATERSRRILRRVLPWIAVAATTVVALELYRGGVPLGPLRKPVVYLPAIVAALAVAAWSALGAPGRRGPVVAAALSLALYLSNERAIISGDTKPANLIPYALLGHGTLSLERLPLPEENPYWVVRHAGRIWSRYPVTAGIVATPVYAPAVAGLAEPGSRREPEKLAAALMCAVSAGFVFAAISRAGASLALATASTVLYAAASPVFATASQALWQHTPSVLAIAVALWATLRARAGEGAFAAWAGLAAGVAVTARFTDVFIAGGLFAAIAPLGWRRVASFSVAAAIPLAAMCLYHAYAFGSPWSTGYGDHSSAFGTPWVEGLTGVLVSPTRGLFTFVPWSILGILGLLLRARRELLHAALLGAVIVTILLYARWSYWWGGWCFGPRMLSDLFPMLAFGIGALPQHQRVLWKALAVSGIPAALLAGVAVYAPRSPIAKAVYEADGADLAMEWQRHPVAGILREVL